MIALKKDQKVEIKENPTPGLKLQNISTDITSIPTVEPVGKLDLTIGLMDDMSDTKSAATEIDEADQFQVSNDWMKSCNFGPVGRQMNHVSFENLPPLEDHDDSTQNSFNIFDDELSYQGFESVMEDKESLDQFHDAVEFEEVVDTNKINGNEHFNDSKNKTEESEKDQTCNFVD